MRTIQLSAIVFALSAIVSCDFIDGPRGGGGTEHEIVNNGLFADAVLSDLEPGTQYYAYAYARSMGMEYRSGRVSFMTLGGFSVSPANIEFGSEGGTKGVSVTYDDDAVESWRISASPRWCSVEKGDRMFFVTVDEIS